MPLLNMISVYMGMRKRANIMKFTYDPRYNVAYIRFSEKGLDVETVRVSDELNVDLTPDGKIYGIELLNTNEQLKREDAGKFRDW